MAIYMFVQMVLICQTFSREPKLGCSQRLTKLFYGKVLDLLLAYLSI
jgi:hypothetical protein